MLNKNKERELAYLVKIDDIKPIPGRDRVECAIVGGWTIMVQKNQFKPGDIGIYFEIDSKVPEKEPFLFLAKKHYKIKTQKYKTPEGQFWSQGLLMSVEDFGWEINEKIEIIDDEYNTHYADDESRFLTKKLEVVYSVASDNKRKAKTHDKYAKMAQRQGKRFKKQPYRWLMRRDWGKKFLFIFFGKKKDKRAWPDWVKKTDEERVQNMPWILDSKESWIVTEKIDGTSTTFTIKRKLLGEYDFYVCSRNVVFEKPDQPCFYDSNVYLEMAQKYDIKNKMIAMMNRFPDCEWITIQGETYGEGVQKRDYSLKEHKFMAFNLINSIQGRLNTWVMKQILQDWYDIPCVPILETEYYLPKTIEELLNYATGESTIDGLPREGVVLRTWDGVQSFKAVSNEYLVKFHN